MEGREREEEAPSKTRTQQQPMHSNIGERERDDKLGGGRETEGHPGLLMEL